MKNVFGNFFSSLRFGARLLLLAYALGFPLALAGQYTHTVDLYDWLALSPEMVWKGQLWRVMSYAFLPMGIVDWAVSLFWLVTLVGVLGKHWSGRLLWEYSLLSTVVGAVPIVLLKSQAGLVVVGNAAMIFGLLVAWYRLYGRERIILLGVGEMSVRQAAILVAIIEVLILFFSVGWFVTLAMLCGGLAGWAHLAVRWKLAMMQGSRPTDSERIVRLEI